jgi:predicted ATPase
MRAASIKGRADCVEKRDSHRGGPLSTRHWKENSTLDKRARSEKRKFSTDECKLHADIARMRRDQGRMEEARVLLTQACEHFTEGFGTADLKRARDLSSRLNGSR